MVPDSPVLALGPQASVARDLLVDVVQTRHDRSAEAHEVSGSRYSMGFASQWRDLLADVHEAFKKRGFRGHTVTPGGYKLPIVHDCLIYAWRVSAAAEPSRFASSLSKKNAFEVPLPVPMLFEPAIIGGVESINDGTDKTEVDNVAQEAGDTMPLVLVMVYSTPRQLQSIEWAVAEFNVETEVVTPHGQEVIWQPEPVVEAEVADFESFDSGPSTGPAIEPREQEEIDPDA